MYPPNQDSVMKYSPELSWRLESTGNRNKLGQTFPHVTRGHCPQGHDGAFLHLGVHSRWCAKVSRSRFPSLCVWEVIYTCPGFLMGRSWRHYCSVLFWAQSELEITEKYIPPNWEHFGKIGLMNEMYIYVFRHLYHICCNQIGNIPCICEVFTLL